MIMDKKLLTVYYDANVGLIHSVARKGYARVQKLGASYDYEDMFQELAVIFVKAYAKFDEGKGVKFSTYFTNAAFNRVNSIAQEIFEERCKYGVISVEEMSHNAGDEDMDVYSVLESGRQASPELMIGITTYLEKALVKLSPLAVKMAQWLISPPDFLIAEMKAHEAHIKYAREQGEERRFKNGDIGSVVKMMGILNIAPKASIASARKEVTKMMAELHQEIAA